MANSPYVLDVGAEDFYTKVLEESQQRPVLVDFWADWCAPCRMLAPLLDSIADSYQGKLLVAKVNTEEQQALAAQFGVRSLPTVKLFRDGQPVDEFMGALPEVEIRAFLEKHLPRESDTVLAQADALMGQGDFEQAAALVDKARAEDPQNPRAILAQSRIQAARGEFGVAEQTLDQLPLDEQDNPETLALRAQLGFARTLENAPDIDSLQQRLAQNENDSEARYQLAVRQVVTQDFENALENLLTLLRRDRQYADDAARKTMLRVFDLLGGSGELVSRYRAKMTSALF